MPAGDTGGYVQKTVNKSRLIPAVIWMYVKYWLSDRPSVQSSVQSESLALKIVRILTAGRPISEFDKIRYALYLDPIIREMAHFLEYAVLAVFVIIAVGAFGSNGHVYAVKKSVGGRDGFMMSQLDKAIYDLKTTPFPLRIINTVRRSRRYR